MKSRSLPLLILIVVALAASVPLLLGAFRAGRRPGTPFQGRGPGTTLVAHDDGGEPKLLVESTRFEFGTMDVGQQGEHAFTVRNVGSADLELWQGKTTCSCTLSQLGNEDSSHPGYVKVPAGGQSDVR